MSDSNIVNDFFYNSQSINFVTDTKGNILLANKQAEQLLGISESAAKGLNLARIMLTVIPDFFANHIKKTVKDGSKYIGVFQTLADTHYKIISQVSTDKQHLFHSVLPVEGTELESTKAMYQTMAELSGDAITVIEKGKFAYISPAATRIFGFTPAEILGEPQEMYYLRILEEDATDFYKNIDESIAKRERFQKYAYRFKTKNGQVKWIEDFVQRKFNKNGIEIMAIINSRDITETKKTEFALLKSQADLRAANAAKDKFFSIIAHDLKSPFSALIGFSELLITQKESIPEEKKDLFLSHIYRSAKSTFSLLENLLLWSRVQTDRIKFEPITYNIKDVIEQNIAIVVGNAENKQIEISNLASKDFLVNADINMTNTVLRNLLSNAVKFTHRGGKITISSDKFRNNFVKISFADTGVGISDDNISKILKIDQSFTTYGTEKEKGSGLGLILCNEFVTINGGKMTIKSIQDKGSVFSFTLKLKAFDQ